MRALIATGLSLATMVGCGRLENGEQSAPVQAAGGGGAPAETGGAGSGGGAGTGGAGAVPGCNTSGAGGATGTGGVAGTGGAAGAGGAGGGPACQADATSCPATATRSGRWCVEALFPDEPDLVVVRAVWSLGPDLTWIAGERSDPGFTMTHPFVAMWNGCAWTFMDSPTGQRILAIWGVAEYDVWFAGGGGQAAHFDGERFNLVTIEAPDAGVQTLSGTTELDIWASSGAAFEHWDGRAWTRAATPPGILGASDVWAAGPNDVWASSGHSAIHFDGTTFTSTVLEPSHGLAAAFANATDAFVAGNGDSIWRFDRTATNPTWTAIHQAGGSSQGLADLGGFEDDIFVVGQTGQIRRWDGADFVQEPDLPAGDFSFYWSVWVSPSQVWVAGSNGRVLRRAR